MNKKVLCVDDDPRVLAAYQRNLGDQFEIEVAADGQDALKALQQDTPYAVVVADMQMPGMNGIELLRHVQKAAPDTVRIMLTGNADQQTAVDAVNQGHVYRFLNKPCAPENLAFALEAGVTHYQSRVAERELLENTLNGSIKVLLEVLSMVEPEAVGLGEKLRGFMRVFAQSFNTESIWELELASMLSQIGYAAIPAVVLQKHRSGFTLSGPEIDMLQRTPAVAARLIANIPRLESVARVVLYQAKHFDGSGFPPDSTSGADIPIGARILKVLLDLVQLEAQGQSQFKALEQMRERSGWYDPKVLDAAYACFDLYLPESATTARQTAAITLEELRVGQMLTAPVHTGDGMVIVGAGTQVTQVILEKLRNFAELSGVKEPIQVEA